MQFTDFPRERVPTNGVTLNTRRSGSGPVVVLLHGWCGSSWSWRKLAPLLADSFTVLVPDLRGYGDSDKPEGGYDAEAEAADVLGLLDHLGIGQAHLVGHDMGAPVALALSGLHPGRRRRSGRHRRGDQAGCSSRARRRDRELRPSSCRGTAGGTRTAVARPLRPISLTRVPLARSLRYDR